MKKRLSLTVAAALLLPGFALAQSSNDLAVYAAMSKLEANAAEASGGLALYILNGGAEDEYAEDYADDVTTFYGYLRATEALEITPEQQASIEELRDTWGPIEDEGEEIIAAMQGGSTADELADRVNTWYDSLDELDDLLDEALEGLLEANDLTVEPLSRDDAGDMDDDDDVGDNAGDGN